MSKAAAIFSAIIAAIGAVLAWSASIFAKGQKAQHEQQKKAAQAVQNQLKKLDAKADQKTRHELQTIKKEAQTKTAKLDAKTANAMIEDVTEWTP